MLPTRTSPPGCYGPSGGGCWVGLHAIGVTSPWSPQLHVLSLFPAPVLQRIPERIVEKAVKGMLPKGRLGSHLYTHLKVSGLVGAAGVGSSGPRGRLRGSGMALGWLVAGPGV
mgnify:CR=1 FL=1